MKNRAPAVATQGGGATGTVSAQETQALHTGSHASNVPADPPGGQISSINMRLSRPMGEWPPPAYPSEVWPISPFGHFTRTSWGNLVPLMETPEPLARGKSFGFLPPPLATRNTIRGVPRVPSTGSRAVIPKGT